MKIVFVILLIWLAWAVLINLLLGVAVPTLRRGPGDMGTTIAIRLAHAYSRVVHRVQHRGLEQVPDAREPGGLIVVSNHTAGIDPLLIQSACPFLIRWMMARDMMHHRFKWFWKWQRIIPVGGGGDARAAREAIRHVRNGGVLGIFPEGGLSSPRGEIGPFMPGIGLVVAKARATVLLVWITGTPETDSAFRSFFITSRAKVEFVDRIEFSAETTPAEITDFLRSRLAEVSGWPLVD